MTNSDLKKIDKDFQKFFSHCETAKKLLAVLSELDPNDPLMLGLIPFEPATSLKRERKQIHFASILAPQTGWQDQRLRILEKKLEESISLFKKRGLKLKIILPANSGEFYCQLTIDLP